MNKQKWLLGIVFGCLMALAVGLLQWLHVHQKLGTPGIKATPIPGEVVMKIDLPERVLDYASTNVPVAQVVLDWLPKDTSYASRRYAAPDGFAVQGDIVLMGMDRSSIHRPDICLPGQGKRILQRDETIIPIGGPYPYSLRVAKWIATQTRTREDGRKIELRTVDVFWYVADNEQTASYWQRHWWMARDMLRTGTLQRWAYVMYTSVCLPGEEEAIYQRMKKMIAASVPEFQLPPRSAVTSSVAKR